MDRNDRAAGSSAGEEAHVSHPELLRYGVCVRPTPIDRGREPCLTRQPRESHQQKVADRSSRMDLRKNEDGSVDIYTGPKAPAGFEKNWIPTVPGKNWFAYFRFYNPTEAYFDRSWPLPDFEEV